MINRLIKTEQDYEKALTRIEGLMDAAAGTPEMDELELLTALVEMYEDRYYPINPPDPVEAIKFRMDQLGLTRKDMVPYLGTKSKVSEVLNGKRPLTLAHDARAPRKSGDFGRGVAEGTGGRISGQPAGTGMAKVSGGRNGQALLAAQGRKYQGKGRRVDAWDDRRGRRLGRGPHGVFQAGKRGAL
jgi:HTH-type transcriptional regulator/antitoxin HigA